MSDIIALIKKEIVPLVNEEGLILYKVENVHEFGMNIYRVYVDDPNSFDIDIEKVERVNKKLLDIVNDELPDDGYLEVSSVGIERELVTLDDFKKALGKYVYVSTYEKVENLKEFYGDLIDYTLDDVTINAVIKTRRKEIKIERKKIAKIRCAVKF